MNPVILSVGAVAPQAWRNGGGRTRELLTWPARGPWQLRISRADIDADGPFSAFPGVTRWFAVLHGNGVALTLDGQRRAIRVGDDALCFDGAQAPECTLLDGPTQDLNMMATGGDAVMLPARPGTPWAGRWAQRGLYTPVAGEWRGAGLRRQLDAHSLLWLDAADTDAWTFTPAPDTRGQAWWLGFTPKD